MLVYLWKKGEILGIHGRSGSGKSTLLKLLMRFYDPKSGSIKINGETLPNINTCSLRDNMAYITQQTYIFNETIEENIRLARRDATLEEIMEAAKKASIHDFILSLPEGYQTKMTELGGNLSDGENNVSVLLVHSCTMRRLFYSMNRLAIWTV